jgi:hypothetical protein
MKAKITDPSKTYRVRGEFVEKIHKTSINFIIETKEKIDEADIVNALIHKHLDNLCVDDVKKYFSDIKKNN